MRKAKKTVKKDLDLSVYTKNGTLRKRKQKTSRNYFTQETEDAIIAYNNTDSYSERNRLFNTYINDSLHKLAENIINTFKFHYTGLNTIEDLKHEVVYFLLEKLHRYDQSQGKAYSYFGTIALRYLIVYNKKNYKEQKDRKELDAVDGDIKTVQALSEETRSIDLKHFVESYVRFVELGIDDIHENRKKVNGKIVKEYITFTEKDKEIVKTVLNLFKRVEELDELGVFYKPALYLQIREATGQKTVDITRVIKVMKCIMQQQLNIYYKDACLDIDEEAYLY